MKPLIVASVVILSVSMAVAGTELDKVSIYVGTWKCQTEHFATPYSKAAKESITIRNECWQSPGYYACNQFVDGVSKVLSVYTYSAKDGAYTVYGVPSDGAEATDGKLIVKNNVWTFPWVGKAKDKTIYFQDVNVFTAPDTIEYREEFSTDGAHWTLMAKGLEKKQP